MRGLERGIMNAGVDTKTRSFDVSVEMLDRGRFAIDLWHKAPDQVHELVMRQVVDTMDEQTRATLQALGWTPPGGSGNLREVAHAFNHFLSYSGFRDRPTGIFSMADVQEAYYHAWHRQENKDGCNCPTHGNWYAADDIDRMVRELDKTMNDTAAPRAKLIDIFGQLMVHIGLARNIPASSLPHEMRLAPRLLLETLQDYGDLGKKPERWMMALLAVALNPEPKTTHTG